MGSVMPTMPPFDAEYAAWPICPSKAATDAVLTMTPRSPDGARLVVLHRRGRQPDDVEGADQIDLDDVPELIDAASGRRGRPPAPRDRCRRH